MPIVVTGFEPLDLLDGIRRAVVQLEAGRHEVENAYSRVVTFEGNRAAQKLLGEVFEVTDRAWRGIGVIPKSGWRLNAEYREFDAEERFQDHRHSYAGVGAMPRGRCVARGDQAGRVRRRLAKSARRGIRWARRWFQAKALARRITTTGGFCRRRSWQAQGRAASSYEPLAVRLIDGCERNVLAQAEKQPQIPFDCDHFRDLRSGQAFDSVRCGGLRAG